MGENKLCNYFNSHPHEEDDYIVAHLEWGYENFNSHPHEEDDGIVDDIKKDADNFNSHPHEEDDDAKRKC